MTRTGDRPYRPRKGWPYSSAGLSNDPILWLVGAVCLGYVIFATVVTLIAGHLLPAVLIITAYVLTATTRRYVVRRRR